LRISGRNWAVSDSTPNNESITEIVPKALAKYLKDSVQGLVQTFDEFPASTQKLQMPSVSVFASSNAQFRPLMPYLAETPVSPVAHKSRIKWVVGIYDFVLQLDLWARNKEERDDLMDSLFNALNPNISPMGLVLRLEEYFNQYCEYLYTGHTFQDSEVRAQRDEWRVTLNVLVTCKAIRERSEFVMEDIPTAQEIELQGQVDSNVVVPEE
jgi:hypothetical protein